MPATIQIDLAFILFLPAFCIVGALYCLYPRAPRGALRWLADLGVLAIAALASIVAMRWGFRAATGVGGALWKQVLATLLAFGFFFAVVGVAALLRSRWFRRLKQRTA
ncbi:MAG: hypothetical protein J0I77_08955 [Rudaea sp.]|uniref:hypothetical protein n=1 Tax=unclassified Rudaea TaxID=2627037 RepID=UPI0010F784A3|nr:MULTISPECIES: hypothetical protein [unclassified Rudaea]MBN8885834.1 hypothetical protein [Rudaea sp.]MBR0346696.1 hypothetical protein [Rudaea sp.]